MRLYFIIVVIMFCTNCREDKITLPSIKVKCDNIQTGMPVSCLFDSIEYIPLETNPNSLFQSVSKLCVDSKMNFYLLDQDGTNALYKFDSNGRFVEMIGNRGKGPQEYLSLSDFIIYQDSLIDMYDGELGKHLVYTTQGKYIEEYRSINQGDARFIRVRDTLSYYASCGGYAANLIVKIGDKQYAFFRQDYSELKYKNDYFHLVNNQIFYSDNYNDTIYRFYNGKLKPYFYIDFEGNKLPEQMRNSEKIAQSNYCYDVDDIKINTNCISFSFVFKNRLIYGFYDKIKCDCILTKSFINDINGIPFLISPRTPNVEGKFISCIPASVLFDTFEYYMEHNMVITKDFENLVERLDYDSNPIVIVAYLKNNIQL